MRKMVLIIGLISVLVLAGCRAETEEITLDNVDVDINLATEEPAVGTVDMLVTVNTTDGDPITDATVTVFGTMTHAGMVPFESSPVTENEDGVYTVPVELSMGGDWVFDVTVELANGESTMIEYELNGVDGEGMDDMDMDMDSDMDMDAEMGMSGTSGAYVTIANDSDADITLVSASADGVNMIELHETIVDENDVARMVEQEEGILIPAGETVELVPGGLHIMLIDLTTDLVMDETLAITLEFDNDTTIEAEFVIAMEAPDNTLESDNLTLSGFWARPFTVPTEMDMDMDSDEEMDMDMDSDEEMDMDMDSDEEMDMDMDSDEEMDMDMDSDEEMDMEAEATEASE